MYSGVDTGENYYLLSAYLVGPQGQEVPLEQVLILRPKYEYRWRVDAEKAWPREITAEELQILSRFAEIFKDDLKEKNSTFTGVRFYLEYWQHFSGTRRYQPDQRRMILEYALQ